MGERRHCGVCGRLPPIKMRKVESEKEQRINEGIESLRSFNNVWNYDLAPKKEEGDTKRRKRA